MKPLTADQAQELANWIEDLADEITKGSGDGHPVVDFATYVANHIQQGTEG